MMTPDELERYDAVLIHLEEVEASDKRCRNALKEILEHAAQYADDESPEGWNWIHVVMLAKDGLSAYGLTQFPSDNR